MRPDNYPDDTIGMDWKAGLIIIGILQFIYYILTIFLAIHTYHFYHYSRKNIAFFSNRHPKFVVVTIILYQTYPLIVRPTADFLTILNTGGIINIPHHGDVTMRISLNIIQFLTYLAIVRMWLLFYDYNHALQKLSNTWKSVLTDKEENDEWTIKFSWLGDVKYLLIIWGVLCTTIVAYLMYALSSIPPFFYCMVLCYD